ncbi:fungal-specific transcription factor domain-containing protein [Exophiala viscosa]|uniref:fungal-specific transcription factor domain-containing protein n=1 Tax=Exophiala viscosa TaxID=2486360 RepID=UPI0021986506|nr:fungal-specific transcription factor domain-containing protein [Exophiala viscosa]
MTDIRGKHQTQRTSPAIISKPHSSRGITEVSPLRPLLDPLVQDLDHATRKYLSYFASDVCKDLVLYDTPEHNPLRQLVPLTQQNSILLQVVVANSALHMSNACQKSLVLDEWALPLRHRTNLLSCYNDALRAKQRALSLLRSTLANITSADIDVALAVVLLFIEFELIDSGRDNWRYHLDGARTIVETWCGTSISTQGLMSPLRSCLISNCLVFDILGSALACSSGGLPGEVFSDGAVSLLLDAEGNHCSSFPTFLLQLIRAGAHLSRPDHSSSPLDSSSHSNRQQLLLLLSTAQSFNPLVWATRLQPHSPASDLLLRTHMASAHRAAVCIYLSRLLLSLCPAENLSHDLEVLVAETIMHLSVIRPSDELFKASPWPAFIAGAETNDFARQEWVARRFHELWEVEPWGLVREALGVLQSIWSGRRSGVLVNNEGGALLEEINGDKDWIEDLKAAGVNWLIV